MRHRHPAAHIHGWRTYMLLICASCVRGILLLHRDAVACCQMPTGQCPALEHPTVWPSHIHLAQPYLSCYALLCCYHALTLNMQAEHLACAVDEPSHGYLRCFTWHIQNTQTNKQIQQQDQTPQTHPSKGSSTAYLYHVSCCKHSHKTKTPCHADGRPEHNKHHSNKKTLSFE